MSTMIALCIVIDIYIIILYNVIMKRIELSDVDLHTVITLKQKGYSWLKIQKEASIPRHIAKRSYNQWQSTKSTDQLKEARKEVAAEEFKEHIKNLVSLAQSIIVSLMIPTPMKTVSSSEINQPWMNNRPEEDLDAQIKLAYRREERLFQSLQEHTQENISWHLLEDWKQARVDFNNKIKTLHIETKEIMNNILSQREHAEVKAAIEKQLKEEVSIDKLSSGIIDVVWRRILTGKADEINVFQGTNLTNQGQVELRFKINSDGLRIDDLALAKKMQSLCKWTLENLQTDRSGTIKSLRNEVSTMRAIYDELEDSLNELVLRPIILKTICKLCPA
jgi:hypothetical protein